MTDYERAAALLEERLKHTVYIDTDTEFINKTALRALKECLSKDSAGK